MNDRERWIKETQMFQRIAGVVQSTDEELGIEWDTFKKDRKKRELSRILDHRVIQRVAGGRDETDA